MKDAADNSNAATADEDGSNDGRREYLLLE
jgi:hypothetical protein